MNWIRELKVGDEFLDSSHNFVGKVLATDPKALTWEWRRRDSGEFHDQHTTDYSDIDSDNNWTKLTPLIKELL